MTLDSTALEERPDDDVLVPPDRGEPGEAGLDTATAPRDADRREAKDDLTSTGAARERMALAAAIERATRALKAIQHEDGYWCTEFEADCTIPAEYILMMHFTDAVDEALEQKIAVYLRRQQAQHDGWSLYPGGDFDISATVKAYYALKLVGDATDAPHMQRAREALLARGGAVRANVFTHITLALFEQIPWRGVPFIPVEIILLPKWFPFHLSKVSYWSRTVLVPLMVLCTLKARAANPRGVDVRELFVTPPEEEQNYFPVRSGLNRVFLALDKTGRAIEKLVPGFVRRRALKKAEDWVLQRLNGDGGLGAIFPAMVNAHEMLGELGYADDHPARIQTARALRLLLVEREDETYCQPCVSPIWDTGLSALALQAVERTGNGESVLRALDWLATKQLLDERGDWTERRPNLRGGGWAFQFFNDHYPDIDDTPVIAWAMLQSGEPRFAQSMERAAEWLVGMQSSNGGWASFDVDNSHYYLNEIPFADHGALLDPPTSDVTARCITFLTQFGRERFAGAIERGLGFLKREQEPAGCWFGRWGTNYVYGTWSVLTALEPAGISPDDPMVRRAVHWLKSVQRPDGGWGESQYSYYETGYAGRHDKSTSFQTAWAVLGLIAAGSGDSEACRRGVRYLLGRQAEDGFWDEEDFTAPGFPRVFYLKYHGYTQYFPLWALARFRNEVDGQ